MMEKKWLIVCCAGVGLLCLLMWQVNPTVGGMILAVGLMWLIGMGG